MLCTVNIKVSIVNSRQVSLTKLNNENGIFIGKCYLIIIHKEIKYTAYSIKMTNHKTIKKCENKNT